MDVRCMGLAVHCSLGELGQGFYENYISYNKKLTKTGEMFSITYEAIEPVFPSIVVPGQVHCVRYILSGILGNSK
jgi:hypothetical protein